MIYFTSDEHYWHTNVIRMCGRPYTETQQMNEDMVLKHNSIVKPEDTVIHLGDFSLAFRAVENYAMRLMGKKLLVPGNHDFCHSYHKKSRHQENREKWLQKYRDHGFEIMPERHTMFFEGLGEVNLCHHPYTTVGDERDGSADKYARWRPVDDGKILICGHVHEKWKVRRSPKGTLMINVGVDQHGFAPVSLDQLIQIVGENVP